MGQASSTFIDHAAATVEIPEQGRLIGRVAQDNTTGQLKSQRFAGIPYAQPPLGPLRWKRPQPHPPTFRYDSQGKQYTHFASQSPQPTNYVLTNGITFPNVPSFAQSEDCLYLNIWCPVRSDGSRFPQKLPVLFFIHGGWLQIGNAQMSSDKDPSDLLHSAGLEAIVVTTAYRLNVFGFLAHDALRKEDPDGLTGNYGFWDQRAALEWVHTNIQHFGGDPHNITVSGLSAGAHSTHSQLMHEFDLSTRDAEYKPIIRRVFLQSNAAIWPSKPVEEARDQLDELAKLLNVSTELDDEEKIARLRQVDALDMVRVLAKMDMHTFRATRDAKPEAFVKPDWTKAMMDGRLARWCQQQGVSFVIGECDDEEWVYRYINTPTDKAGLVRQVHNYYTLPLVERMLPYYGIKVDSQAATDVQGSARNSRGKASSAIAGEHSLYDTLGVKPSATTAEIRAAYLAQVRLHHPDKLQQQAGQSSIQIDLSKIADSPNSDNLIRRLNYAYKILSDDQQRSQYDDSLSAARAASSSTSSHPRISATVDFESFQLSHEPDLIFSYPCRCGSTYNISEDQIHNQIDVIGCDGCSENIRIRYDDDTQPSQKDADEIGSIFGRVCSDSQVYIAERMFITDLIRGGFPPERVLRYRINYRVKAMDEVLQGYGGVSHSFDDFVWWFGCLQDGKEKESVKRWLRPWIMFVRGEEGVCGEWYGGRESDGGLIRVLEKGGSVRVERDERWEEKEELIEAMMRVRRELVDEWS